MKIIFLHLLQIIILLSPTIVEVMRDRNGDAHPNSDWKSRTVLCMVAGFIVGLMMPVSGIFFWSHLKYAVISGCLFASTFNLWINWVHLKNRVVDAEVRKRYFKSYGACSKKEVFMHVVSHLSKSAWPDKTWWWRAIGWQGRLIVNTVILIGGLYLYFM